MTRHRICTRTSILSDLLDAVPGGDEQMDAEAGELSMILLIT
jgi:hypothetical protein